MHPWIYIPHHLRMSKGLKVLLRIYTQQMREDPTKSDQTSGAHHSTCPKHLEYKSIGTVQNRDQSLLQGPQASALDHDSLILVVHLRKRLLQDKERPELIVDVFTGCLCPYVRGLVRQCFSDTPPHASQVRSPLPHTTD